MTSADYAIKPHSYFNNARMDFVNLLVPRTGLRILEIGCGTGSTGEIALQLGICAEYCGIEINHRAANVARNRISRVINGNIEDVKLPWQDPYFDVLIMSEVLEHLADPWAVVKKTVSLLRPGGLVMASSPNVSHYRIIMMLMRGKWNLSESGPMDRTHLRWFTPSSYRTMFEDAGIVIDRLEPVTPPRWKPRCANFLTAGAFNHIFVSQINLIGHKDQRR
jgi:2-polyprenyl-3-methyl-5-hydroxy-6-metoxy-1,4-benzoquinol methylase